MSYAGQVMDLATRLGVKIVREVPAGAPQPVPSTAVGAYSDSLDLIFLRPDAELAVLFSKPDHLPREDFDAAKAKVILHELAHWARSRQGRAIDWRTLYDPMAYTIVRELVGADPEEAIVEGVAMTLAKSLLGLDTRESSEKYMDGAYPWRRHNTEMIQKQIKRTADWITLQLQEG